jgi:hypothetical protein
MATHSWSRYDWGITACLAGGTVGAAGWILGAAEALTGVDAIVVLLAACGVLLTGLAVWCLYLAGRRMSLFFIVQCLLGSSLVFGMFAIVWMHVRGVLAIALDANQRYPAVLGYAAPLVLFVFLAATWWPATRKWVFGKPTFVQRGTPEGQRPGQLFV